ncbi:trans-aconitate 2-methyltransferase [Streptomyces sp. DH37]|uniref:class I SAM-dependent methyltransferase n=1 Tax=Streptomyces sp. DH37 TaxID=3040122 RepID=UPI0024425941|nr:class I SAM-dependent methyltransferase [Streptomyces sp. DH37]MDG9701539.1 class I SAM-dependent methyltransferase [Streptomyces sp. DH37]
MSGYDAEVLFGPFRRIKEECPQTGVISYYEGAFYEFERVSAWPQTWDIDAFVDCVDTTGGGSVLDVGCGEGRVLWHLARRRPGLRLVGLESSADAHRAFAERFRDTPGPRAVRGDITAVPDSLRGAFDLTLLSAVTINGFPREDAARAVLRSMAATLAPGGCAAVTVFPASVRDNFRSIGRVVDAVPYRDALGTRRMMWRGMDYDHRTHRLRHNFFVEGHDGERIGHPGLLGVRDERVWSSEEILELAGGEGLEPHDRRTVEVEGGGAQGWVCDVLLLRATRTQPPPDRAPGARPDA